jgi:hypothetical protein
MSDKYKDLQARIRKTPLIERLAQGRQMIGKMCSEKRPPKMSIPVSHRDEDIFITTTLQDAIEALEDSEDVVAAQSALAESDERIPYSWVRDELNLI